jgi:hypothetical protein
MKKNWLVIISLVAAIAMLGVGLAMILVGDDERTEWGGTLDIIKLNPEHRAAFEKLVNASRDLNDAGVPLVDFGYRAGSVVEGIADLVVEVGLREVKDEYKKLVKAIVEGVEGIEFEFFQARFTQEQIADWQDDIVATFWAGTRPLPPGAIDVPLFGTVSSWREQKIWIRIEGEVKPEYIEAIRMVVGEEAPLKFEQSQVRYAEPDIWILGPFGPPPPPGEPPHYRFEPAEYTVTVNTSVVLRIHNPDKVPLIFIISGLNVKKELYPGRITPVHFTARQIGRYEFYIEGLREKGLVGTLIVR